MGFGCARLARSMIVGFARLQPTALSDGWPDQCDSSPHRLQNLKGPNIQYGLLKAGVHGHTTECLRRAFGVRRGLVRTYREGEGERERERERQSQRQTERDRAT